MPINAIASGTADVVGPPIMLTEALCHSSGWGSRDLTVESHPLADVDTPEINHIFALLRNTCEIDFSQYKHSTLGRRIRRRMSLRDLDELSAYGDLLASDSAERNALHLLDLVNDILDLSKLESARLSIESELVSLPALVAGLKSMHKMRAEQKNLALSFHCLISIPQKIRTDPVRIRQVLVNLISNAVKFTEEGSISVEFETQDANLIISVRDTGPGIAADQLNEMFLPFRQGTLGMRRGGTPGWV